MILKTFFIILVTAIVTQTLAYIVQVVRHIEIQLARYKKSLSLLQDEVGNLELEPWVFDPDHIQQLKPIAVYAPHMLLTEHFEELEKNVKLLHAVSDFHVSMQTYNSFLKTYHDVIWRNTKDVEMRGKMFKNAENLYANLLVDRRKILELGNRKNQTY